MRRVVAFAGILVAFLLTTAQTGDRYSLSQRLRALETSVATLEAQPAPGFPISHSDGVYNATLSGFGDDGANDAGLVGYVTDGTAFYGINFDLQVGGSTFTLDNGVGDTSILFFGPTGSEFDKPILVNQPFNGDPTKPDFALATGANPPGFYEGANGGPALAQNGKQLFRCDNNAVAKEVRCTVGEDVQTTGSQSMVAASTFGYAANTSLTESSATTVMEIPTTLVSGGRVNYCVLAYVSEASLQTRCGTFTWQAISASGTVTAVMVPTAPDQSNDGSALAATSGTLSYTWTADVATANVLKFKLNATSSLSQIILAAYYSTESNVASRTP